MRRPASTGAVASDQDDSGPSPVSSSGDGRRETGDGHGDRAQFLRRLGPANAERQGGPDGVLQGPTGPCRRVQREDTVE